MNEKFFAQVVAELKAANEQSLTMLAIAVSKQLDAQKLKTDLEAIIKNSLQMKEVSPVSLSAANRVLAAVHAEALLQASQKRGQHRPS